MKLPRFRPMLPVSEPLQDESSFVHEIKWDGFRALAYLEEQVTLESRGGAILNARFPQILRGIGKIGKNLVLDGEIIALNQEGKPEFSLLKASGETSLVYVVFDILFHRGKIICKLPWQKRRAILENLVSTEKNVYLSPLLTGRQQTCLQRMEKACLEGIVSKEINSPYLAGRRSLFWRKQKIIKTLDCVVVGLNRIEGRIRSFLAGLYDSHKALFFIGSVGSGLANNELIFLKEALALLAQDACPVVNPPGAKTSITWFRPHLVAEVQYLQFTPAGKLRHASFLRFRFDKKAFECVFRS